jgi:hypothetical protein
VDSSLQSSILDHKAGGGAVQSAHGMHPGTPPCAGYWILRRPTCAGRRGGFNVGFAGITVCRNSSRRCACPSIKEASVWMESGFGRPRFAEAETGPPGHRFSAHRRALGI